MVTSPKSSTKYITLAIIVLGTSAIMLMMTVSTAYAQSQRASAAACPEGFQLNRGVCQAEPTLTCEPYGYPPHKIRVVDGQCELIENASPGCVEATKIHNQK